MKKIKIITVCLGNICRSPLAEGILRSKLPKDQFEIDSAGTANYHVGNSPDRRSIEVGKKYGIDISNLRGRQFKTSDFEEFDYIFIMDESNYANVTQLAQTDAQKAKVHFILDALEDNTNAEVPDPYYGDKTDFEKVYKMLDEACERIAEKFQK